MAWSPPALQCRSWLVEQAGDYAAPISYHTRDGTACFDHGIRLAQAGADLPDWLFTAPRWARAAVAIGRSSALRMIQEDRLLSARGAIEATNPMLKPEPFWRRWMG
jgi:hypothetical protein